MKKAGWANRETALAYFLFGAFQFASHFKPISVGTLGALLGFALALICLAILFWPREKVAQEAPTFTGGSLLAVDSDGRIVQADGDGDLIIIPGWQPIETAPKGNHPCVLLHPVYGEVEAYHDGGGWWNQGIKMYIDDAEWWRPRVPSESAVDEC